MKCIFCGAEATALDEIRFKCPFCGGAFEQEKKAASETKPTHKSKPQIKHRSNEGANVFEDNVNGVLEITWNPSSFVQTSGSGFLVNEAGYALTNAHVVTYENGTAVKEVNVKIAGTNVKADVIRLGDNRGEKGNGVDLALIKLRRIPAKAKTLVFADFDKVRIGEQVFVIGNSLGDGTCITAGIVSDKQRRINGHMVLMTDCAINGGNSGGPIFNIAGEVIGVICSSRLKSDGSAAEGMNYAIPINIASDFLLGKHVAVNVSPDDEHINYKVASNPKGPRCPRCKSSSTDVENGIAYCYDCDYEWGV